MKTIFKKPYFPILSIMIAVLFQGCNKSVIISFVDNGVTASQKGTATIQWSAPTINDDGSTLADLSAYRIKYGTSPGIYTSSVDTGNVTQYTVQNLDPGKTYYFTVTALNSTGDESPASNEASKSIQ